MGLPDECHGAYHFWERYHAHPYVTDYTMARCFMNSPVAIMNKARRFAPCFGAGDPGGLVPSGKIGYGAGG